ncbi:uncharacterized protein LOC118424295 [Branchiostoma floridae]|uniref:Uncharacterized protein LOC118424295 n=1 Tax=Branchiostoma floridae TaxID=7739 RepID=A0A9J7LUA7_BRAFL|nr:uncharacterized protein LOC118424295 [Branchiostoma floridae]
MASTQRNTRASSQTQAKSVELREKLSADNKLLLDAIEATLLLSLKSEIQELKSQLAGRADEQREIKSSVAQGESLKSTPQMQLVRETSARLNDLEQYSRRNCLLLHGAVSPTSDTVQIILDTAKNTLGIDLSEGDIDRAHPLPRRKGSDGQRPPPIVIKFVSYTARHKFFSAKSKLKGSKLFVTEQLTKENALLLRATREKMGNGWSMDGRIYCLHDSVKKRVANRTDLDNMEL